MDIFEQKQVLNTFEILVDTREQDTKRARKRYESFGVPWRRATIDYGDYIYNAILPDGTSIYDASGTIYPTLCAIERKMSLDELADCFGRDRCRFTKEFEKAKENGCQIYLLCENANWENLINGKYRSGMNKNAYLASASAWMVRYNANVIFCKEETSGRLIKEILFRDLKERLERGEFDENGYQDR